MKFQDQDQDCIKLVSSALETRPGLEDYIPGNEHHFKELQHRLPSQLLHADHLILITDNKVERKKNKTKNGSLVWQLNA